jgi:DNA-damage-inducible protein D
LAKALEYSEYRHFLPVIEKAKEACKNSGHNIVDYFEHILDMIEIGKGGQGRRRCKTISVCLLLDCPEW